MRPTRQVKDRASAAAGSRNNELVAVRVPLAGASANRPTPWTPLCRVADPRSAPVIPGKCATNRAANTAANLPALAFTGSPSLRFSARCAASSYAPSSCPAARPGRCRPDPGPACQVGGDRVVLLLQFHAVRRCYSSAPPASAVSLAGGPGLPDLLTRRRPCVAGALWLRVVVCGPQPPTPQRFAAVSVPREPNSSFVVPSGIRKGAPR